MYAFFVHAFILVCVLVNIAIFIWIVLLAALSYPFAYPAVGVKVTAGEAEPMP